MARSKELNAAISRFNKRRAENPNTYTETYNAEKINELAQEKRKSLIEQAAAQRIAQNRALAAEANKEQQKSVLDSAIQAERMQFYDGGASARRALSKSAKSNATQNNLTPKKSSNTAVKFDKSKVKVDPEQMKSFANQSIKASNIDDIVANRIEKDTSPSFGKQLSIALRNNNPSSGTIGSILTPAFKSSGNPTQKDPNLLYRTDDLSAVERAAYRAAALKDPDNPAVKAANAKASKTVAGYKKRNLASELPASGVLSDKYKQEVNDGGKYSMMSNGTEVPTEDTDTFNFMTKAELDRYNEIYGVYGVNAAEEYRRLILNDINQRIGQADYDQNMKDSNIVTKTLSQYGTGIKSGLEGIANVPTAFLGLEHAKADSANSYKASAMRADEDNSTIENIVFDIANSTGNMTPSIALSLISGGLGGAVFALSQYGNTYRDDINAGRDPRSSQLHAIQQGIDEAATNWLLGGIGAFGGGALIKALKKSEVGKAAANAIAGLTKNPTTRQLLINTANALSAMGSEGLQEYTQYYTNALTENLLFGENNDLSLTNSEAWYSAFLGALNAGVLNLPGNVAENAAVLKNRASNQIPNAANVTANNVAQTVNAQNNSTMADNLAAQPNIGTQTPNVNGINEPNMGITKPIDNGDFIRDGLNNASVDGADFLEQALNVAKRGRQNTQAQNTNEGFESTSNVGESFETPSNINEGFESPSAQPEVRDTAEYLTQHSTRYNNDQTAKELYLAAYNGQNAVDYDEALATAYTAGKSGISLYQAAQSNNVLNEFYGSNMDLVEDMWRAGYQKKTELASSKGNTEKYSAKKSNNSSHSNNDTSNVNHYTVSTYNRYGWAYVNNVLNNQNSAEFFNRISNIKNGYNVRTSSDGLYMVETSSIPDGTKDTIIYTDGDYNNPSVERVIKINAANETEASNIKRIIYESEENRTGKSLLLDSELIRDITQNGVIEISDRGSFQPYNVLKNGSGRTVREKGLSDNQNVKNRQGSNSETQGNRRGSVKNLRDSDVIKKRKSVIDEFGKAIGVKTSLSEKLMYDADGLYNLKTGEMVLSFDADAGTGFHEMVHVIAKNAPEYYNEIADAATEAYISDYGESAFNERIKAIQDNYLNQTGFEMSKPDAIEEFVADTAKAFADADYAKEFAKKHTALAEKFKGLLEKICNMLNSVFKEFKDTKETKALKNHIDLYEKAYRGISNGIEAVKRGNKTNSIKASLKNTSEIKIDEKHRAQLINNGVEINDGAATKFSLKSYNETDKQRLLDDLVYAGYDKVQAQKWIDDVSSVASIIAKNKNLDYTEGSGTWLKNNAETIKSLDGSFLCPKKSLFQGTYNAILEKLPNIALNADEYIELKNMLTSRGYEVPCVYCYNESRTQNLGQYAKEFLEQYKGDVKLTSKDLTTTEGLGRLQAEHADVYDEWLKFRQSAHGMQRSVKFDAYNVAYHREDIMNMSAEDRRAINNDGGLRWFAFSDFKTEQMIDCMQAVLDLAAMNMKSYAYTKQEAFVRVFGDTNIITNLSVAGELKNGKLVFDSSNGMDINTARKLRKKYSKTAGITLVGVNDEHILAAMASPEIDMIIPFHRSGLSNADMKKLGIADYTDYQQSGDQNEHWLSDGKKVANNLLISDYWNTYKSGKENAQRYLKECARTGREPKFSRFLDKNTDSSGRTIYSLKSDGSTDGYWKLLVDHKMYDNDGVGIEQEEVIPNFDMAAAKKILKSYEGNANEFPVAQDVVDAFVDEHNTKYSLKSSSDSSDTYKEIRNALKDYTFHMPEGFEGETEKLGGVNKLRKEFFRTLNITKNKGMTIDQMYQELAEVHPEMFDPSIDNPADQLEAIVDRLREAKSNRDNDYEAAEYAAYLDSLEREAYEQGMSDEEVESYIETTIEEDKKAAEKAKEIIGKKSKDYKPLEKGISNTEKDRRLRALAEKYGALPRGEHPLRDVTVPKQTSEGMNVRRFARTVLESDVITDEQAEAVKQDILDEALSYEPVGDLKSINHAKWEVEKNGIEHAQKVWDAVVYGHEVAKKGDIAVGEALLKKYAENGDTKNVLKMVVELATEGTRAGQVVQAMSMLKKLSTQDGPEAAAATLYSVRKAVDKINSDYKIRFKHKREIPQLVINEGLAAKYLETDTVEGRERVLDEIYEDLADQTPNTIAEKLNQWRYLAMLGNPRTHIRNLVGNAIFMPAVALKNTIATGIETVHGGEKTKAVVVNKAYKDFAAEDFKSMKGILQGQRKGDIKSEILSRREAFGNSAIAKPFNKIARWNSNALEAEDLLFLKHHYIRALSMYLQSHNVDLSELRKNGSMLAKAQQYAINEAQKATYRDASATATMLNQLVRQNKPFGFLIESILPFKKTPINILKRGVEYSPIGLINGITIQSIKLRNGDITFNEWADSIASGLSGTSILAIGMFLAKLGILSGAYSDDDDDKDMQKLMGQQEYAINLFGYSYTVDWAAPVVLPLIVGAETMSALDPDKKRDLKQILESLQRIAEPMIEMSMLSGLNDAFSNISYANNKLTAFGWGAITGYLSQFVPTIAGQVARTIDPTQRIIYADRNSPLPKDAVYFIERMQNRIPGLSFLNSPKLDQWGEPNVKANYLAAAFENFVSPGYVKKLVTDDKVDNEIVRLNSIPDIEKVTPTTGSKYFGKGDTRNDLTSEEYYNYQSLMGQTSYNLLDNMIDEEWYNELTPSQQSKVFGYVYDYSKTIARMEVEPDYVPSNDYAWVAKAIVARDEADMDITDYIRYKATVKDYKESLTTDDKQPEMIKFIKRQKLSKKQNAILWDLAGYKESTLNKLYN